MLIGVPGELGVDGQPNGIAALDGQLDRKLHALRAPWLRGHVLGVLVRRQYVPQDRTKLDFAQDTTRFHIREHTLEVAHPRGDVLHVAKTAIHRLELAAHLFERSPEAVVEGGGELLIHRGPDCLELELVIPTNSAELHVDGLADLV